MLDPNTSRLAGNLEYRPEDKLRPGRLLVALVCAGLVASSARAQTVRTDSYGSIQYSIAAAPTNGTATTYLALAVRRQATFRGTIRTVGLNPGGTATLLTFPTSLFANGQFTGPGNASYIEFTNGTYAGLTSDIVTTTPSSIELADNVSAFITAGSTTYRIRPHWTIATAFGVQNSAGLLAGASEATADTVQIYNSQTAVFTKYYFSSVNNRWETSFQPANDVVLRPDTGVVIERRLTSPVTFSLVGEVKRGPTEVMVFGSPSTSITTIVPNPYPVDSKRLADLNLYTGSAQTGLVGGTTWTSADNLLVYNPAKGGYSTYYFNTTSNRWQITNSDASNVTIKAGVSVQLLRRANRPTFLWYIPEPNLGP